MLCCLACRSAKGVRAVGYIPRLDASCPVTMMTSAQLAGSPSLTKFTQTPSDMQHGDASRTEQHTADTTGFSSDRMQIHKPVEGYTSDLSQHPGSSRWLPQPLQLLYGGDSSMCTPTADTMAGETVSQHTCEKRNTLAYCGSCPSVRLGQLLSVSFLLGCR